MRWAYKHRNPWRRQFAFVPMRFGKTVIWLEPYWRKYERTLMNGIPVFVYSLDEPPESAAWGVAA